jgi:hypothetical protein
VEGGTVASVHDIPEENWVTPADPQPGQPRFVPPGETGKGVTMSPEELAALPDAPIVQIVGDSAE